MVQLTLADAILSSIGGILISLSTSFHLLVKGRVTGFSGIFYSLITFEKESFHWKLALVCGLTMVSSILYNIFKFDKVWDNTQIFDDPKLMIDRLNYIGYGLSGYLVGLGTKLSNGCTSGHGVCGLPRFSNRSWISVCIFLLTGIGISTLRHYFHFLYEKVEYQQWNIIDDFNYDACANSVLGISIFILIMIIIISKEKAKIIDTLVGFITGVIFALGLSFGGMLRRSKINGFLSIQSNWDPSLLFLLGFAVGCNMITFYLIQKKKKPLLANKFGIPNNKVIDLRLILGSIIFGLGWGIGSLCPGPALSLYPIFSLPISVVWITFLGLGQLSLLLFDHVMKKDEKKKKVSDATAINEQQQKEQQQQEQEQEQIQEQKEQVKRNSDPEALIKESFQNQQK